MVQNAPPGPLRNGFADILVFMKIFDYKVRNSRVLEVIGGIVNNYANIKSAKSMNMLILCPPCLPSDQLNCYL